MPHKIVFLGDVAYPREEEAKDAVRFDHPVVVNLEGAISRTAALADPVIFSTQAVIGFLKSTGVAAASLANNHSFDTRDGVGVTTDLLSGAGIQAFGVGSDLSTAGAPALIATDPGPAVSIIGTGWRVIGCPPASDRTPGVFPLVQSRLLSAVSRIRSLDPSMPIVVMAHWGYELSEYPQPAHRDLAMNLIDEGINAVIGCHAHRAQGAEIYRGSPIVYGLGNWFFPPGFFIGGTVHFPSYCDRQLAFYFDAGGEDHLVEEYSFNADRLLPELVRRVSLVEYISQDTLSPFQGMTRQNYLEWFRRTRPERARLLPTYSNPQGGRSWRDGLVHARTGMARTVRRAFPRSS